MNKKISIGVTIALALLTAALTASVTMAVSMRHFSTLVNDPTKQQAMFGYVTDIDKLVRQHVSNLDEEKLQTALARGYIAGIDDPYASFLTAEEYKAEMDEKAGKQVGIGVEVTRSQAGEMVVTYVQKNSPAAATGLQKGDILTAVDGEDAAALGIVSLREKLATAPKVLLTYTRAGESKALEISASQYTTVSVEGSMLEEGVGYIHIRAFNDTTLEQFKSVYNTLDGQGALHYIFDLRNTAGGSLDAATDVIAYLMPRGGYARLETGGTGEVQTLFAEDSFEMDKNSVTLVNGNTRGVPELFAGVLQEFGKTTVVGGTTAGRGMVQECFPISTDGSAVKLSVSQMFLLKRGNIEGAGILPDQEVLLTSEEHLFFALLDPAEDPQLQTAIAAAKSVQNQPPVTETTTTEPTGDTETTETSETGETTETTVAESK